jgi:hypothetical protein
VRRSWHGRPIDGFVVRKRKWFNQRLISGIRQREGEPMWVSQTYLTNLRADGAVAAYYLFEAYRDDHAQLEKKIRSKLALLARSFGDSAHVFVPNRDERGSIEREFNDWIHRRGLQGIELPGLLILEYAMGDERSYRGYARFISFSSLLEDSDRIDSLLEEVKQSFARVSSEMHKKGIGLERALENIQVKPNLWGVGYDFTPHIASLTRRMRDWRKSKSEN